MHNILHWTNATNELSNIVQIQLNTKNAIKKKKK